MSDKSLATTSTFAALRRRYRGLALATGAVLIAHWGLLQGVPEALATYQGQQQSTGPTTEMPFVTRTLLPPPAAPEPVAPRPRPAAAQPFISDHPSSQENQAPAPVESAQAAINSVANAPQAPTAEPEVQQLAANTGSPSNAAQLPKAQAMQSFAIPGSVRLKYNVKIEYRGVPVTFGSELLWLQDGKTYDARMEISMGLLGSVVQTSKGQLGDHGLEPLRFSDKRRSEVAAHFERGRGLVVFSANTPDAPLLPGAQDQLSMLIQLASMIGGAPGMFAEGMDIPMQSIGPRSSESWTFTVGKSETLTLPGGPVNALKLNRPSVNEFGQRAEIWLAPDMAYMPVRIRLTEANGDVADQMWVASQQP